jgi:hypothetical protein
MAGGERGRAYEEEDRRSVVMESVLSYDGLGMPAFPVSVRTK